ncbi:hypothetical protein [Butyrivibrio proteoclasticus]|uniref:hypothetical protein n=1 Tax=Butyrivibrio proteoclasticus TaxID=43305 RepID=UPI00047E5654|nr:hypothetical protein [Butyrivibrio proteoclasticus]
MKKKVAYFSLVVALFVFIIAFFENTSENKIKDTTTNDQAVLDDVLKLDDQETTARKLFEAAYEDTYYASHLRAHGYYEDSSFVEEEFTYDYYYGEDGSRSVLEGKSICDSNPEKYVTGYLNVKFSYYKWEENGVEKDGFLFNGCKGIAQIVDVGKFLWLDLTDTSELEISIEDYSQDKGYIYVSIAGKDDWIQEALPRTIDPYAVIHEVKYKFDADTHKLLEVDAYAKGDVSPFMFFEMDYEPQGDHTPVEIPQIQVENGILNGMIVGDKALNLGENVYSPFIEDSTWAGDARAMVEEASAVGESSFPEFLTALEQSADLRGLTVKEKSYAYFNEGSGLFVLISFSQDEKEIGSIVFPLAYYDGMLQCHDTFIVSANDQCLYLVNGDVEIIRTISDSLYKKACYSSDINGYYSLKYKMTREEKISNLSVKVELKAFSETDWPGLKILANDYLCAEEMSLTKYEFMVGKDQKVYYVPEGHEKEWSGMRSHTGLNIAGIDAVTMHVDVTTTWEEVYFLPLQY